MGLKSLKHLGYTLLHWFESNNLTLNLYCAIGFLLTSIQMLILLKIRNLHYFRVPTLVDFSLSFWHLIIRIESKFLHSLQTIQFKYSSDSDMFCKEFQIDLNFSVFCNLGQPTFYRRFQLETQYKLSTEFKRVRIQI